MTIEEHPASHSHRLPRPTPSRQHDVLHYFLGSIELLGNSYPCQLWLGVPGLAEATLFFETARRFGLEKKIPVQIFYDGVWCKRFISPRLARRHLALACCR